MSTMEQKQKRKKKALHKLSRDRSLLWALLSLVERDRAHRVVTAGSVMPKLQPEASLLPNRGQCHTPQKPVTIITTLFTYPSSL